MLYGQSFAYGKSPGASVINRFGEGGKRAWGKLLLDVDGQEYTIVRCRGTWKAPQIGLDGGTKINPVMLFRGTENITAVKTPQDAITSLLGMPARTFTMSVMFPAEITRFPSMGDAERKAVLDDLLETTALDEAHTVTKGNVTMLKEKVRQGVSALETAEGRVSTLQAELDEAQGAVDGWEAEHKQELDDAMAEVRVLKVEVTSLEGSVEGAEGQRDEDAQEATKRKEIAKKARESMQEELEEVRREWTDAQAQLRVVEERLGGAQKVLKRAADLIDKGKCPTCGTDTASNSHLCADRDSGEVETKKLSAEVVTLEKLVSEKGQALRTFKKVEDVRLSRQEGEAEQAAIDAMSSSRDLQNVETAITTSKTRLKGKIELAKSLASETNPHATVITRIAGLIDEAWDDCKHIGSEVEAIKKELEGEEIMLRVFGPKGARLAMMERAIPLLNSEAQRIADVMGTQIKVNFALRKEGESWAGSLQIDVDNPKGAAIYRGQSRGEKRRAEIIILLALLQLAISRGRRSFRQVFFDEAFESLTPAGEEAVMLVMRDMSKNCSSVFTINHTADRVSAMADKVWTVDDGEITFAA